MNEIPRNKGLKDVSQSRKKTLKSKKDYSRLSGVEIGNIIPYDACGQPLFLLIVPGHKPLAARTGPPF